MNAPVRMVDAQAALGFVIHQRSHIEPEVLRQPYTEVRYSQYIPVDTAASQWARSVTFFTADSLGRPKFISGKGDDIPLVNLLRTKFEETIQMAGIGYSFSLEEIGAAQALGQNLPNDGAVAAREAYEQFVDQVTLAGDAATGIEGFFTMTGITEIAAASTFAAAGTPQAIVDIINNAIQAVWTGSNGIEMADTIILPLAEYARIASTPLSPDNSTTVLELIQRTNIYTLQTGRPLTIAADHRLTTTMMVYRRDPRVLKMHMPMPLQFIDPQPRNLEIVVPGMFRFSPVNVRRPGAVRRVTGIA